MAKAKEPPYESKIKELNTKVTEAAVVKQVETDRLYKAPDLMLAKIAREDKKKIIRDLVDKITVYEGGEVELRGHLPLFDHKLGYGAIDRNCGAAECGQEHAV